MSKCKCQPEYINKYVRHDLWSYKYNFSQMHGCQKGMIYVDNKLPFSKIFDPETGA